LRIFCFCPEVRVWNQAIFSSLNLANENILSGVIFSTSITSLEARGSYTGLYSARAGVHDNTEPNATAVVT